MKAIIFLIGKHILRVWTLLNFLFFGWIFLEVIEKLPEDGTLEFLLLSLFVFLVYFQLTALLGVWLYLSIRKQNWAEHK